MYSFPITHPPPQIGVHEGALESVHEREFAKFLFSLQSFVWRTQRGLIRAPAIPETGCRRTSEVHRQHSPQPPPARRHTMVRSEKVFLTAPSCAASARAPLSARLRYPPGACRPCITYLYDIASRCTCGAYSRSAARARPAGPYSHHLYSKSPVWPRQRSSSFTRACSHARAARSGDASC